MPITQIDKNTALIVIDLQQSIVAKVNAKAGERIIRNTNVLLDAFHSLNLPVVLVNVSRQPNGRTEFSSPSSPSSPSSSFSSTQLNPAPVGIELVEALKHEPQDIMITKEAWGAFSQPALNQRLQALGVTQIVLTGIATSMGVLSTALQAYELGYNVTICHDAVTDVFSDNHHFVLNNILPKISEIGETQEVINHLN